MNIDLIERWIGWAGGLAILLALAVIFRGLFRGLRRPAGMAAGRSWPFLRSPLFYFLAALGYFGLCALLWRPLPFQLSPAARILCLALGAPIFFSGLALVIWSRLVLGRQYFVSTSFGAQLFADHQLVTGGPYALVRHPMYLGLLLTGLGGLLLFRTWTFGFIFGGFFGVIFRARREEQALEAAFGEQWRDYRRRVHGWLPFRRNLCAHRNQIAHPEGKNGA